MTGARQALSPQARRGLQTLALAFALSLGAVLALYLAGGWRPYVNAPAGFHYGVNSPFEALTLLLPHIGGLGVNGVFLAEPVSNCVGGLACYLTMRRTVMPALRSRGQAGAQGIS